MLCNPNGFDLTKDDARALLAFASKDATRPHLFGIAFEPRQGRAFATDGHTLAMATNCGKHDVATFVLSRVDLESAIKAAPKGGRIFVHWPSASGSVTIDCDDREHGGGVVRQCQAVPATPPPVDQVVPARRDWQPRSNKGDAACSRVGVNAAYLARLELVQKASERKGLVAQMGADDMEPMRFDTSENGEGEAQWIAIIMPMRR